MITHLAFWLLQLSTANAVTFDQAKELYNYGQYFSAARAAFAVKEEGGVSESRANVLITKSLMRSGLSDVAVYFFLKVLSGGDLEARRDVIDEMDDLVALVGPDLMKASLLKYLKPEELKGKSISSYRYLLAKEAVLSGEYEQAIKQAKEIRQDTYFYSYGLQIRGTANAILNRKEESRLAFKECLDGSRSIKQVPSNLVEFDEKMGSTFAKIESKDLEERCRAGLARVLYEMERFDEAEETWDRIPKNSIVWTDTLFEQSWNAYARQEFTRTLGRLITYKSPSLQFVFNPEVDLLVAQTYYELCRYDESSERLELFQRKYSNLAERVKSILEKKSTDLKPFYSLGKEAFSDDLHSKSEIYRVLNRFTLSPYFRGLLLSEQRIVHSWVAISSLSNGDADELKFGFAGFLREILNWRLKSIEDLGGAFIKNNLLQFHKELLDLFDKAAFIKLETLKLQKDSYRKQSRIHGAEFKSSKIPERRLDQFYWDFDGEYWADELGDYIYGTQSLCRKKTASNADGEDL